MAAAVGLILAAEAAAAERTQASSTQADFPAAGAVDGDRFAATSGHAWKGESGPGAWRWQVDFGRPRRVGAILQVQGDHDFVLRNAPTRYDWLASLDGTTWKRLPDAAADNDQRLYRIHRLRSATPARFLRLEIRAVVGDYPTLREVEFFDKPSAPIAFPPWILVVNTTHDPRLPSHGQEFIPLARACPGWEQVPAQQVWLTNFNVPFVTAEPRPLCAFLSGNFKDWCEVNREWWRGTQAVLRRATLPMWASCGGAQGLALLSEYGVDHRWDCPHCRDPLQPQTPIYGHIGHTGKRPCGDYSACEFERGEFTVRQLGRDPVFAGLPDDFRVMESHCGQIEWPPRGWELVATAGPGAKTKTQCLRLKGRCIYAAQFHIEMAGTPETSRLIMGNFLRLAKGQQRD